MNYSNQNPFDESALKFESNGIVGLTGLGKEKDYLRRRGYTLTDTPDLNVFLSLLIKSKNSMLIQTSRILHQIATFAIMTFINSRNFFDRLK